MATSFLRFTNIVIAGLLAGTSFGILLGFNPKNYSAATYLEQQQHLVLSLNALMVSLVIAATVITLVLAFVHKSDKSKFIALLAAAACFVACIFISRFGNLPIQQEMLTWKAETLPPNWAALRDEWWSLHVWRTMAELVGFGLVAWVNVRQTKA